MMVNLSELNKAMVEAMKVIAPEDVKCLRKMEKERVIISDLMNKEFVLGDFGTSSFKEVLKVIDYRIEEWYYKARDKVTEHLINCEEEDEEEEEFDYEWITTLPEPNHNDNPFSDDGDSEYDHLDCDGTAW